MNYRKCATKNSQRFLNRIMNKQQGRITISRYAVSQEVIRGKKEKTVEHRWYLWITRLYSCVDYSNKFNEQYKIEKNGSEEKFIYDSRKTVHPMHISSFKKKPNPQNERGAHIEFYENKKFYIAVKELIIEWEDYQAEVAGYIHCEACEDLIDKSGLFNNPIEKSDEKKYENPCDSKQLLRFVKSPGLRTTHIKIGNEDMAFLPIELKKCKEKSIIEEEYKSWDRFYVKREHQLDCEIRPLFDPTQRLPIKYAHFTVEIYMQ